MDIPEDVGRELTNRLARIEGQLRGVRRMVGEQRDCREVVTQMSAATRALDRARVRLLVAAIRECAIAPDGGGEDLEEFEKLLIASS